MTKKKTEKKLSDVRDIFDHGAFQIRTLTRALQIKLSDAKKNNYAYETLPEWESFLFFGLKLKLIPEDVGYLSSEYLKVPSKEFCAKVDDLLHYNDWFISENAKGKIGFDDYLGYTMEINKLFKTLHNCAREHGINLSKEASRMVNSTRK